MLSFISGFVLLVLSGGWDSDHVRQEQQSARKGPQIGPGKEISAEPVKCMTPYILLQEEDPGRTDPALSEEPGKTVPADMLQDLELYYSKSGRFRIEYRTSGFSAVPAEDLTGTGVPDFVEWTADYADHAFERQVVDMGFVDPTRNHGEECGNRSGAWQDTVITIRYRSFNAYGEFNPNTPFQFTVHNNFEGFPENTDPDGNVKGALKATVAHELKHVIQYATNCLQGDAGSFDWVEMDATMMENVVFPEVNDYYNYIGGTSGIFGNPRRSTPVAYSHVTWSLFYAEELGIDFWVDTWEIIRDEPLSPLIRAMRMAMADDNYNNNRAQDMPVRTESNDFITLFIRNHLWHAASGSRSSPDYGFSESVDYPDASVTENQGPVPEPYTGTGSLDRLSATYSMFYPASSQTGNLQITAEHSSGNMGVGILAYKEDGSTAEWLVPSGSETTTGAVSPFLASNTDSFLVALVNADPERALNYEVELSIKTIPEEFALEPNYPNPFSASGNPGTNIVFLLPEREHVTITVYDAAGRKVAVLFDDEADPGRHVVSFEPRNLASGVYIYRVHAGPVRKSGKMTFIR